MLEKRIELLTRLQERESVKKLFLVEITNKKSLSKHDSDVEWVMGDKYVPTGRYYCVLDDRKFQYGIVQQMKPDCGGTVVYREIEGSM